ncbi:hypothetical protein [Flavobacterium cheniae]|uniref:Uncharacterized protein n=1 Tax=Flavobacterium cheniae TaxID=295428 RepID=A0A562KAE1_9FLAO|nr:hypothetical protein [Flavobacterium cheniae]TDR24722.1 hypothetical protein C8D80_1768 [Flavobacterium cheniae]TWH92366.1 hypothetical protein IP97_02407 [Flavobacterium cheniae]
MKKRISAELISIAHRILKLKNHSETVQLQQEAKNLYDQLTILRFYEENFELVKNEISEEVLAEKLEGKPTEVFNAPIQDKVVETPEEVKVEVAPEVEETIAEPIAEEKVVIAELIVEDDEEEEEVLMTPMDEEPIEEEIIEEEPVAETPKAEEPAKQISFEDLLVHDYKELDFVKVEDIPAEVANVVEAVFEAPTPVVEEVAAEIQPEPVVSETPKVLEEEVKATFEKVSQEPKISSLNDRLNKTISFGLNDRIGFEKKLFGGSSDDFNRVISQLNTFDSFEEAKSFVLDFVKPDYNNWEGNEEFEARFMEIIEKKFS